MEQQLLEFHKREKGDQSNLNYYVNLIDWYSG